MRESSPVIAEPPTAIATFPAQPVGTAKAAVAPFARVPGATFPLAGAGAPALLAWAVVMAAPFLRFKISKSELFFCGGYRDSLGVV